MGSKKLFLFIVIIGLIPLIIVFAFFIYRIKLKKKSSQESYRPGAEKASISPEWIQSSKSALQKLADHSLIGKYLEQKKQTSANGKSVVQPIEEQEIYGYIEDFQSLHPEFEEIILKDPQTGTIYLSVPSEASREDLPDVRLVVSIAVLDIEETTRALLQGFVNLDLQSVPQTISKREFPMGSKKKLAMIFVWLFALMVIIIPVLMFLIYRQMNKMLDARLPKKAPPSKPPWEQNNCKNFKKKGQNE